MPEHKEKRITRQTTKSTLKQLNQREKTFEIIEGIARDEIPESIEEPVVLYPNQLDGETRFGVKKKRTLL